MSAEIPDGAVLVARAILNSSLWTMRPADCKVAVTCIALCNSQPSKWFDGRSEITILRGSFVRSWGNFVKSCALPLQVVRTSVEHLEVTNFLTRFSTRLYTVFTLPKYEHYQDLTKYSDSVMLKSNMVSNTPLTTNNNNRHQKPIRNLSDPSGKKGGRNGVAVVVPERTADPILEKTCVRVSMELLASIKMADSVARAFAATKSAGEVLRVVQQARLQKKPAGWARTALENDWLLPEAGGPELEEVVSRVTLAGVRVDSHFRKKISASSLKVETGRRPGEDEASWFKRVNDDIRRTKESARSGGREKGK